MGGGARKSLKDFAEDDEEDWGDLVAQLSPGKAGKHHAAQVDPRRIVFRVGVQIDLVDIEGTVGAPVLTVESHQIEIDCGGGGGPGGSSRCWLCGGLLVRIRR